MLDENRDFLVGFSGGCSPTLYTNAWIRRQITIDAGSVPDETHVRLGPQQCLAFTGNERTSLHFFDVCFGKTDLAPIEQEAR
jgi:hypothetical protein